MIGFICQKWPAGSFKRYMTNSFKVFLRQTHFECVSCISWMLIQNVLECIIVYFFCKSIRLFFASNFKKGACFLNWYHGISSIYTILFSVPTNLFIWSGNVRFNVCWFFPRILSTGFQICPKPYLVVGNNETNNLNMLKKSWKHIMK